MKQKTMSSSYKWPSYPSWLVGATIYRPSLHQASYPSKKRFTHGNIVGLEQTLPHRLHQEVASNEEPRAPECPLFQAKHTKGRGGVRKTLLGR